jgi:hypothetical protein
MDTPAVVIRRGMVKGIPKEAKEAAMDMDMGLVVVPDRVVGM